MIKRELYLKKIRKLIDLDIIKAITGMRRSGKSFMLKQVIDELKNRNISEKNILLINFENPDYSYIENRKKLDDIIIEFIEQNDEKKYLLFDEIQHIPEWEKSIAGYKSRYNCDIYITGSNSELLTGTLATRLTGRYMEIRIYPLSFEEFIDFHELKDTPTDTKLRELLDEYLKYGGLPFTINLEDELKKEYIQSIYSNILYNDIIKKYDVRNIGLLEKLMEYLINNSGNQFSLKSVEKYMKHENISLSNNTIYNYLKYIENAYLIQRVPNERIEDKKILRISEKYYIADIGFYDAILGSKDNYGRKIENMVYLELIKHGYRVTVGKTGNHEIDFICRKNNSVKYVQVCASLNNEDTRKREFRALLEIMDNYPKYIISLDFIDYSHDGIVHMNLLDFLTKFE